MPKALLQRASFQHWFLFCLLFFIVITLVGRQSYCEVWELPVALTASLSPVPCALLVKEEGVIGNKIHRSCVSVSVQTDRPAASPGCIFPAHHI